MRPGTCTRIEAKSSRYNRSAWGGVGRHDHELTATEGVKPCRRPQRNESGDGDIPVFRFAYRIRYRIDLGVEFW